jgi:hypothetical protein
LPCTSADHLLRLNVDERDDSLGFGSQWRAGLIQKYNLSARGGSERFRYRFSMSRNATEGVVRWSSDERNILRTNIEIVPNDRVSFAVCGR